MKEILKNNIKLIFGLILGVICSLPTVYGALKVQSSYIPYSQDNVISQKTLYDELDTAMTHVKENCYITAPPYYFALGVPTNSSTTDYNTLGKSVFVGKKKYTTSNNKNGELAVCIKRNRARPCFYSRNFEREAKHLLEVYSYTTSYCSVSSSEVKCKYSDFSCYVKNNGEVACTTPGSNNYGCRVNSDNTVFCGTITIN